MRVAAPRDSIAKWTTAVLWPHSSSGIFGSIPDASPVGKLQGGGGTQQIPSPGEGLLTRSRWPKAATSPKVNWSRRFQRRSPATTQAAEARYQEAERQALQVRTTEAGQISGAVKRLTTSQLRDQQAGLRAGPW
jgi:hypothetical protein